MFDPKQLETIVTDLLAAESGKPVSYTSPEESGTVNLGPLGTFKTSVQATVTLQKQ